MRKMQILSCRRDQCSRQDANDHYYLADGIRARVHLLVTLSILRHFNANPVLQYSKFVICLRGFYSCLVLLQPISSNKTVTNPRRRSERDSFDADYSIWASVDS